MQKMLLIGVAILMLYPFSISASVPTYDETPKGNLCYAPESHDFGDLYPGEVAASQFEIWACCGCQGGLSFNLVEDCDWLEVSPKSGYSVGERHTITVTVNTEGLAEGSYSYEIRINSNSGVGFFEVRFNVTSSAMLPSVEIEKPRKGGIYINDNELFNLLIPTIVIGKLTISIDASASVGSIEKVELYINDEKVADFTSPPYTWVWDEKGFMRARIKAIAYSSTDRSALDEIVVWRIL